MENIFGQQNCGIGSQSEQNTHFREKKRKVKNKRKIQISGPQIEKSIESTELIGYECINRHRTVFLSFSFDSSHSFTMFESNENSEKPKKHLSLKNRIFVLNIL